VLETLLDTLHRPDPARVLPALAACVAVLLVWCGVTTIRVSRLSRRLRSLTRGSDSGSLEDTIAAQMASVEDAMHRMDRLEQAVAGLQAQLPECIQYTNLVRYDAFDDVGGEQSFSLALLNGHGDGLVVTSVYSRTHMRVYAKQIRDGQSTHALSAEEQRALAAS
jgi:hypothetical protein